MWPCGSGFGVLIGEREAPALQLSFLLPPTSKQGRGALCLLIPTSLLPKGDAALPQVKTGIWWTKEGCFLSFSNPGWGILPGLTVKVF